MILRTLRQKVHERKLRAENVPDIFRSVFVAAKNLDIRKPISEAAFVILDTETTGLRPEKGDELLSVAGLGFGNGRLDLSRSFYELIKPEREIPKQSVVIHNLTPAKLKDLPTASDVLTRFFEFCGGDVLVGHHVALDVRFINSVLTERFGISLTNRVIDTAVLARSIQEMEDPVRVSMEGTRHVALDELAERFDIKMPDRHDAYGDAFATALIFQRQLGILEKKGIKTVKDLVHIGGVG
jgi:DNA polymerase-3 subunit epsilon